MMNKQSIDFVAGYIFGKVEKQIIKAHTEGQDDVRLPYQYVPKLWFGLKPEDNLPLKSRFELQRHLETLCQNYNTKNGVYTYSSYIDSKGPYILVVLAGTRVVDRKEMTVEEIEKELGYKVKIVGEH